MNTEPATPRRPSAIDSLMGDFAADLTSAVADPDRVKTHAIDRLGMAHDASHFLLTPRVVVVPADVHEVSALLRVADRHGLHLTFRSGGTSLSGQGVTDGMLIDIRRFFRQVAVLDGGERVRVQPGAVLRHVNNLLRRYGRKLGPDPASESACTVGGVIANNSSGMACGVEHNAYKTLESIVLVLPSGTVVDTGAADADARLQQQEPALHAGLLRLRDEVRADRESVDTLHRLFSMKNTMGYALNAFLDHSTPVKILEHLMVGSEGTLGFVSEATFRTVPVLGHAATGLLVFDDLKDAAGSLPSLVETGAATIEILDAASLRVAQHDRNAPDLLKALVVREHAALLVEYQAASTEELERITAAVEALLARLPLATPTRLSRDPRTRADLWHVRKGLYAAVAGARPAGSTALLEDVAVPVASLLSLCTELVTLFERRGYADSVIFGHAKDGNIHFLLNEYLDEPANLERYHAFTEELVELVLRHGGTLKAEHGTGRMMAPYVRRQYGDALYAVMREVKQLCDPAGLLNPGVLVGDDEEIHLRHLKPVFPVEPEVDRCVECGYCEPVCPSQDLTTTPRQRIVLRRERVAAEARGDTATVAELDEDYPYAAVDTCAADGMCQTACPVDIDTGDLVRRLRSQRATGTERRVWEAAARHWSLATRLATTSMTVAGALPTPLPRVGARLGRRLFGEERVPQWSEDLALRRATRATQPNLALEPVAVLFSSCTGAIFGAAQRDDREEECGNPGVGHSLLRLFSEAELGVVVPNGVERLCCGMPWKSKGMVDGFETMRQRVLPALWEATDHGRLPIVSDASSCTEGLIGMLMTGAARSPEYASLRVIDAVEFVASEVLPLLGHVTKIPSLALHPTCSSTRLGLNGFLRQVAHAVADDVVVADEWRCCAFAGDRGLLRPELTRSATRPETEALAERRFSAYASCNHTCELGMTRASGHQYRHIIELLERAHAAPS